MDPIDSGKESYEIIRAYRNRFALLISSLVLVILSSTWFVKNTQEEHIKDSTIINLASKQRVLMQQTAKLLASRPNEASALEITNIVRELRENQTFITQQTDSSLFEDIESVYLEGSPSLSEKVFATADKALLASKTSDNLESIRRLITEIDSLSVQLDEAVAQLDHHATEQIQTTVVFLYLELVVAMVIIIFVVLTIYKPMDRSIADYLFDISNRKKAALYMLDNTPDATVSIDGNNLVTYFSKRAEELWGYAADEVLGKNVSMLVPKEMRSQHDGYIEANRKTGVSKVIGSSRDIELYTKSGELRYCILHIAKSQSSDGSQGYTAFVRDVTENRIRQKELEEARKIGLVQSKLASIGELAAGVAHEINNPLAVIRGYSEIGLMKSNQNLLTPEEIHKYFSSLLKQTDRIVHIVNGMKNISRMEGNSENLSIENVSEICAQTIELLKTLYAKSNIDIVYQAPEQPVFAYGNLISIQQILINLLNNAKDATEDVNSASVEVSVSGDSEDAIICVKDNGAGIKPEDIDKLFEPFFTTKPVGKGTGLGLSIISRLLKDMSGTIQVDSEIDKGTAFTIRLKRASIDEVPA